MVCVLAGIKKWWETSSLYPVTSLTAIFPRFPIIIGSLERGRCAYFPLLVSLSMCSEKMIQIHFSCFQLLWSEEFQGHYCG